MNEPNSARATECDFSFYPPLIVHQSDAIWWCRAAVSPFTRRFVVREVPCARDNFSSPRLSRFVNGRPTEGGRARRITLVSKDPCCRCRRFLSRRDCHQPRLPPPTRCALRLDTCRMRSPFSATMSLDDESIVVFSSRYLLYFFKREI